MRKRKTTILLGMILLSLNLHAQWKFEGQSIGWGTINPDPSLQFQSGLRYLPSLSWGKFVKSNLVFDSEFSANMYGTWTTKKNANDEWNGKIKPYRLWIRLADNQWEFRAGLQKINFGSATLLRSLMWFDRIDPRDPLQLTDGVYGLLARYYFVNNTNIWFWGLYGNQDPKGWELLSTDKETLEWGGRIQMPVPKGEIGLAFHQRRVAPERDIQRLTSFLGLSNSWDFGNTEMPNLRKTWERRVGFDTRWDIEIGLWTELAMIHTDFDWLPKSWQRLWTLGADYTFSVGNGLHALYEHFGFRLVDNLWGQGDGAELSALSLNYPIGMLDNLTGMLYFDWENESWYRFVQWQRAYDNWLIFGMVFWNPDTFDLYQNISGNNLFAGKGFQIMIVFNH